MIIVLIVWFGIFLFLLGMERRIKSIEKELKGENNEE